MRSHESRTKHTWTFVSPPTRRTTKQKSEFLFHQQNIKNHMKKTVLKLTLGIAAFAAMSAITQAQTATATATNTAAPAAPPSAFDEYVQQIKNPVDWFSWGGDMRVRNEYFNNALSLGSGPSSGPFAGVHEQDYFRFREIGRASCRERV